MVVHPHIEAFAAGVEYSCLFSLWNFSWAWFLASAPDAMAATAKNVAFMVMIRFDR